MYAYKSVVGGSSVCDVSDHFLTILLSVYSLISDHGPCRRVQDERDRK